MSKRGFKVPRILLNDWGGDVIETETGLGTAGSTPDVMLCSWFEWLEMFGEDLNGDGDFTYLDYYQWWTSHEFTEEQWILLNENNQEVIDFWASQQQP